MQYTDAAWRATQRIRLDINRVFADVCGSAGLTAAAVEQCATRAQAALQQIQHRREALGWLDLPAQDVRAIEEYAAAIRDQIDTFVVLGIGGSALGNVALHNAVNGQFYNDRPRDRRNGPRLMVIDNSDPEMNAGLFDVIDPQRTVFNVISKSGTTAETMASFLYVRDQMARRVGEDQLKKHIVLTTDPSKGFMRQIGEREGWTMFDLPPKVGGRFSVLTAVGLLSAAMTGIDIRALLAGAAYGEEICREADALRNPAALGAIVNYLCYQQGKNMVVMLPYAQRLKDVSDWFAQLWAESLGKRVDRTGAEVRIGATPIKALGATDQHSQVQLYAEGPHDKLINFLAVQRYQTETAIPGGYTDLEGVSYLGGHTFTELIQAEQQATAVALSEAGQPSMTHILPEINAFTIGQLFMLFELQTAIAGELYNIDAYDQPGVEAGKVNTYALLGRAGYEGRKAEIESAQQHFSSRWVI